MPGSATTLRTIDLRSDTITRPSDEMRKVMAAAEVGDDVFGEDPTVNRLQDMAAEKFNKEAALYVPSGTMANEIAVKVHTQPGDEVIVDTLSHIINFESGAPGLLSGVNLISLNSTNGALSAKQIEKAIRPDAIQYAKTSLICLENTNNYAGGSIFPYEEIKKIAAIAQSRNVNMHLDGARIFNAVVETGIRPDEYAQHFDSLTFCVSKGLGAPVGSVLMGNHDFIKRAIKIRKIFGGGMRQAGILAAAGIYALEHNIERLKEDHRNAKAIAAALQKTETFDINPDEVQTNIIIFHITDNGLSPEEAAKKLADCGILVFPFGEQQMRAVTHLEISRQDTEEVCERLIKNF